MRLKKGDRVILTPTLARKQFFNHHYLGKCGVITELLNPFDHWNRWECTVQFSPEGEQHCGFNDLTLENINGWVA